MNAYLDLKILPDPEFPTWQVMDALFAKLHRLFVELKNEDIAVSFPEISKKGMGDVMRLIGPRPAIESLMTKPWLKAVKDHLHIGSINSVPPNAVHRKLSRVQVKSNPERLIRRRMKRHGLTADEARAQIPDKALKLQNVPFVSLSSSSTGQRFHLFIKLGDETIPPQNGRFNAYGLSQDASVPWF